MSKLSFDSCAVPYRETERGDLWHLWVLSQGHLHSGIRRTQLQDWKTGTFDSPSCSTETLIPVSMATRKSPLECHSKSYSLKLKHFPLLSIHSYQSFSSENREYVSVTIHSDQSFSSENQKYVSGTIHSYQSFSLENQEYVSYQSFSSEN